MNGSSQKLYFVLTLMKFSRQIPVASSESLDQFERDNEVVLPAVYREFLCKYGGGEVDARNRTFSVGDDGLPLERLFGIADSTLASALDDYRDREWMTGAPDSPVFTMPKEFLPFGETCFGDYFCIGIRNDLEGQVYFWSHDSGPVGDLPEDSRFEDFYQLTNDLSSFIHALQPSEY